ncbi:MAG TPA: hypothetical protein VH257_24260, partial [Chloroflexota bacterium]|nr:hypothetical protein [Chloroflexota bacterium]
MDVHAGAVELEGLAARLIPPCPSGPYTLTGRVARTSNALVFAATGGACGEGEGILKLTGNQFGPLLERELRLLVRCRDEGVEGVIRPLSDTPIHLSLPTPVPGAENQDSAKPGREPRGPGGPGGAAPAVEDPDSPSALRRAPG